MLIYRRRNNEEIERKRPKKEGIKALNVNLVLSRKNTYKNEIMGRTFS